jgi:uncharacterized protein YjbI with pentapeptide repeats
LEGRTREPVLGDYVGGDKTSIGNISNSLATAIGTGAKAVVKLGKELREEQYEIAWNWDGQRRVQGFDLSGRDLSKQNLALADFRKSDFIGANLSETNLRSANLGGANLSGANLSEAKYNTFTTWPDGFKPEEYGAILEP